MNLPRSKPAYGLSEALMALDAPLQQRFNAVRAQSERLLQSLSAEDCALQTMPDASPLKWHLAHTKHGFSKPLCSKRQLPAISRCMLRFAAFSIRTRSASVRVTRGRNAACCRAPRWMKFWPIAVTSTPALRRCWMPVRRRGAR